MKLAKEFDKNLVELDAVQEQENLGHTSIQTTSEPSSHSKDEINTKNQKSLLGEGSETDAVVSLKPVGHSTGIPVAEPCQSSSQKSVDLEAEVALHALFDSSTQKCSGQLSQGLSDTSLNNSFHTVKSTLEEENLPEKAEGTQHGNSEVCQKDIVFAARNADQAGPKPDNDTLTKKNPPYLKTHLVASAKLAGVVNDDFDDWDTDLLADDSFVMQITQNPELISAEEPPQIPAKPFVHDFSDASRTKQRNSGNSVTLLGTVNKSNSLQYSPLKHSSKNSQSVVKSLSLQKPCKIEDSKTETKALHGKCDVKTDKIKSVWKSTQNSDLNHIPVPVQSEMKTGNESTKPKSDALPLFPSRSNPHRQPAGKPGSNTHTVSCQSPSVSTNMKPTHVTKVVSQANTGHSNQVEIPKKYPESFDDWNEPKFSDEVLGMFCGSDSLWDANCEDDELLYQVCDDIEKQTQTQDVKQGNEKTKTLQGASVNSRSNAGNSCPASKQGLPDLLLAQKTNAKREALSINDSCRNSPKTVATTGHVVNCKNISNPQTVISGPSVECKNTLPRNTHQAASEDAAKTVSGKWYRSNSVPAGEAGSEVSPVNGVNTFSRKALDSSRSLSNAGKIPSSSSGNKTSLVPSKFKFRKINSSQGGLCGGAENPGNHSGVGIALQGLEGSKNQVNVTLHNKLDNKKSPFKRHLSESFVQPTSGIYHLLYITVHLEFGTSNHWTLLRAQPVLLFALWLKLPVKYSCVINTKMPFHPEEGSSQFFIAKQPSVIFHAQCYFPGICNRLCQSYFYLISQPGKVLINIHSDKTFL